MASGTQRRSRLLELGADHVVDRTEINVVDSVRQYTHGTGVGLVIDPVETTLPASLSVLAPEGRLVFVGNACGGQPDCRLVAANAV
ncbi:MAG: zinc-binding dehydrogenase [Serratia inhibens]